MTVKTHNYTNGFDMDIYKGDYHAIIFSFPNQKYTAMCYYYKNEIIAKFRNNDSNLLAASRKALKFINECIEEGGK